MDKLREVIQKVKGSRVAWLELVSVALEEGVDYDTLKRRMEEEGVSPPTKAYWRTLVRVYEWARAHGVGLEELSRVGVSKAEALSKLPLSPEEVKETLSWASTASLEEVKSLVRESLSGGDVSGYEKTKTIKVPEGIYEALVSARSRLARIPGVKPMSDIQFLEFAIDVFLSMDENLLKRLWLSVFGEAEDRVMM